MATVANRYRYAVQGAFATEGNKDKMPDERIAALIWRVTCLAWAIEKLLSWRIWTTYRMLPTLPVFANLAGVPPIFHTVLFAASMLLLFGLIPKCNRQLTLALLAVEVCQCLLDQTRVQPWEYQYFFIGLLFVFYPNEKKLVISSVTFVLASTYFYSGLNKLNQGFLQSVWSNLILHQFFHLNTLVRRQEWLFYCGYLLGLTELALGVGLLFKKTRKASAILLVVMHLVILAIWGPFGLRGFQILWFWNLSMIALLYLVFILGQPDGLPALAHTSRGRLTILLWGILPALSPAGLWPKSLSSNMFSGNAPWMVICVQNPGQHEQLKRFSNLSDPSCICKGALKIDLQTWVVRETRVSVNPEKKLLPQMQQRLLEQYPDCRFTFLIIQH